MCPDNTGNSTDSNESDIVLGEPERTQGDLNFSLLGIPVRIHPFFWLIAVMLGPYQSGLAEVVNWVLAMLVGILVHEFGHALVVRAYGSRPWVTLYGMGGVTSWNPADDYRKRGSSTLRQIAVSAAGPAAGFLLAALLVGSSIGLQLLAPDVILRPQIAQFIDNLLFICIVWGILNLLPIYPLDGGQIAREIFLRLARDGIRESLILSIITAVAITAFAISRQSWFTAFLFGYLAYSSFAALQAHLSGRRW